MRFKNIIFIKPTSSWGKNSLNEMILSFVDEYKGRNRILHMDNYYNSVVLSTELLQIDIHTNGTIRHRRGVNEKLMKATVPKHKFLCTKITEHLFFYNYNDNKNVYFISSVFGNKSTAKVKKI